MYVCICRAVTDRTLSRVIAQGARSVEEIAEQTGAGTCCGSCIGSIQAMLHHASPSSAEDASHDSSGVPCSRPCATCPSRSLLAPSTPDPGDQ